MYSEGKFSIPEVLIHLLTLILQYLGIYMTLYNLKRPEKKTHFPSFHLSMLQNESKKEILFFTSFLPKSPPGFMVATRRKPLAAVISSTSSLSPLPFSARTRDFSVSRTLTTHIHTGSGLLCLGTVMYAFISYTDAIQEQWAGKKLFSGLDSPV